MMAKKFELQDVSAVELNDVVGGISASRYAAISFLRRRHNLSYMQVSALKNINKLLPGNALDGPVVPTDPRNVQDPRKPLY